MEHQEDTTKKAMELARLAYDSMRTKMQQGKHLYSSMTQWAQEGFKKVSEKEYESRLAVCRSCEHWEENAAMGYGRCRMCGCGKGKHWLPHEQCPIGKWGKIVIDQNPKPPVQ